MRQLLAAQTLNDCRALISQLRNSGGLAQLAEGSRALRASPPPPNGPLHGGAHGGGGGGAAAARKRPRKPGGAASNGALVRPSGGGPSLEAGKHGRLHDKPYVSAACPHDGKPTRCSGLTLREPGPWLGRSDGHRGAKSANLPAGASAARSVQGPVYSPPQTAPAFRLQMGLVRDRQITLHPWRPMICAMVEGGCCAHVANARTLAARGAAACKQRQALPPLVCLPAGQASSSSPSLPPAEPAAAPLPAGHSKPQPRSLASCATAEEAAVARDLGWIWLWKRNTSLRQHAALNFSLSRWLLFLSLGLERTLSSCMPPTDFLLPRCVPFAPRPRPGRYALPCRRRSSQRRRGGGTRCPASPATLLVTCLMCRLGCLCLFVADCSVKSTAVALPTRWLCRVLGGRQPLQHTQMLSALPGRVNPEPYTRTCILPTPLRPALLRTHIMQLSGARRGAAG